MWKGVDRVGLLPVIHNPAVNLIGEHPGIVSLGCLGDVLQIRFGDHPAGWVAGRVDDDQLGALIDQPIEDVQIK